MSNQIFKKNVPIKLFYTFLDKICIKTENYYLFDNIAFNKARYHSIITDFLKELTPYYHISKLYYIERPLNYSKFITIIRQICRNINIHYKSFINYNKSNYDISYHIYYDITFDKENNDNIVNNIIDNSFNQYL